MAKKKGTPQEPEFPPDPKWVMVSPEMAEAWLERAVNDPRKVRDERTNAVARNILDGRWLANAQAVQFNVKGELFDGFHRLTGIVKANRAALLLVAHEMPVETVQVVDTGASRNLGDYLHWRGEKDRFLLGSILRLAWLWEHGHLENYRWKWIKTTHTELISLLDQQPEIRNGLGPARVLKRDGLWFPNSVGGAFYWKVHQRFPEDAERWIERVASPYGLERGDPIAALRKTAASDQSKVDPPDYRGKLAQLIIAFNYSLLGTRADTIRWRPNQSEAFPELIQLKEQKVKITAPEPELFEDEEIERDVAKVTA